MPARLTKKIMGFPLWVWLSLLAVSIILGLYLRARRNKEVTLSPNPGNDGATGQDVYADQLAGNTDNPSLAGVLGPVAQGVVPVASPQVPAEFGEGFSSLVGTIGDLVGVIGEKLPSAVGPDTAGVATTPSVVTATTGGGAPARPANAHVGAVKPKGAVAGLPKEAGNTVASQSKWLSTHPEWAGKNKAWAKDHPVMYAYAATLPGNRLPNKNPGL